MRSAADEVPGQVDLAHEPQFELGRLVVTPAALSVAIGPAVQRLERRVMQVLVVLAHAAPDVISRTELNARVWGGRVVGDDAINRAIQTLRRVATDVPPPQPFTIETVPRIGYRLTVVPTAPALSASASGGTHGSRRSRTTLLLALGVTALIASLIGWQHIHRRTNSADWLVSGATGLDNLPLGARDVALSPNAQLLAYRGRDSAGRERIFVCAMSDGGVGRAISPANADARRPVWDSESRRLAFIVYDPGQPCRIFVMRVDRSVAQIGACETVADPRLAWSPDGGTLLFGDAPGVNAVHRIGAIKLSDGTHSVVTSPPGDSMGDDLPLPREHDLVFQRQFGWADEGWIARDTSTGRERQLWRRGGVAGTVATILPDGSLAIAWTRNGASGLDIVDDAGRSRSQPVAFGPVTAITAAGAKLLVEADRSESALARGGGELATSPLATVRGRIAGPTFLPDGRLRFPVTLAGVAHIWDRGEDGSLQQWGTLGATRIVGIATSQNGRFTATLITGSAGREFVVLDARGKVIYRWNPHARSANPAAWSSDGHHLVAPVIDGTGWRLFELDPFGGAAPRDLQRPGFAVVMDQGAALYAVRAGESTGIRELWRLDGRPRRLPIDLTLLDIVNWRPVGEGVWLPDRSNRANPRLVLRETTTGRVLRSVNAAGLAGAASGLAANPSGPVYVRVARDDPEYAVLSLTR